LDVVHDRHSRLGGWDRDWVAMHWVLPRHLHLLVDVVGGVAEHDLYDAVVHTDLHPQQCDEDAGVAVVDQIQSMAQYQSWMRMNVCNWGLEFDNCLEHHGHHHYHYHEEVVVVVEEDAGQDRMVVLHQSHHRHRYHCQTCQTTTWNWQYDPNSIVDTFDSADVDAEAGAVASIASSSHHLRHSPPRRHPHRQPNAIQNFGSMQSSLHRLHCHHPNWVVWSDDDSHDLDYSEEGDSYNTPYIEYW